jgi:hypothetical protein
MKSILKRLWPGDPPKVLILTPVKDAADLADTYLKNLESLSYPHHRLSLGLLESDSRDGSEAAYRDIAQKLSGRFRQTGFWKKDFSFQLPPKTPRWAEEIQAQRRTVLARSRNHLLFHALDDEDWVLWLDVDVIEYPKDLIEKLLSYDKDILQPHCVLEYGGATFDKNGWRDQGTLHLEDLRPEGKVVQLDAVGGTVLLIRADLHRDGLIFPPYFYGEKSKLARLKKPYIGTSTFGEIETEGLGMMAADMGATCWGLPHLEVKHRNK